MPAILTMAVSLTVTLNPAIVQAQQNGMRLEEVVVTAQRREQSLQEVPISIGVYSGAEIELQGYKRMQDLAKFSPSVNIKNGDEDSVALIRGFGSQGNAINLQSATPLFLDGVHFGRRSMVQTAFLDTERVEILKGPQPLFFGMNATGGAFNVLSKRPTPEWEGDLSAEFGNFGRREVSTAFGGPVTETIGIRIAGLLEREDGVVKNRITREREPNYDSLAGRATFQWTPNDRLDVVGKFEIARQRNGLTPLVGCLTGGAVSGYNESGPLDGGVDESLEGQFGGETSAWANPPVGIGGLADVVLPEAKGSDCFEDAEYGFSRGGPFLEPVPGVHNQQGDLGEGILDIRAASAGYLSRQDAGGPGPNGFDVGGVKGHEHIDTWNTLLDISYTLGNGMILNSESAFIDFYREASISDNRESPFLTNHFHRYEDIQQWSQQVRLESRAGGYDLNMGGDVNMEFMFGAHYQESDLDGPGNTLRATVRRAQRFNNVWEDSEWFGAFGEFTFKFMDQQLSVSAGARYTDVQKTTYISGFGAQWIVDERPCDSDGTDADPGSCTTDPDFVQINPALTSYTVAPGGDPENTRIDSPTITVDPATVNMNDLWAVRGWNITTATPLNWRGGGADAVGLTAPNRATRNGPYGPCAECSADLSSKDSNIDFQVVFSFTPDALGRNHTFYAKYAEAFKGPVADTGRGSIPSDPEEMLSSSEFSNVYEVGAKGTLMDARLRYDIAVFSQKFNDLQAIGTVAPIGPSGDIFNSESINVDQKTEGIEFSTTALITERLTFNMAGALMDSTMNNFLGGGCSANQTIAEAADAVRNPGDRTADELVEANDILDTIGPTRRARALSIPIPEDMLGCRLVEEETEGDSTIEANTINRNGIGSPQTPDWKFVFGLDYRMPLTDRFEMFANIKGFFSDSIVTDPEEFDKKITFHKHGDMNVQAGFGPQDGRWQVIGFVRNLLEATEQFNPEYDFEQPGLTQLEVRDTNFRRYGVRFEYQFR